MTKQERMREAVSQKRTVEKLVVDEAEMMAYIYYF